MRKSISIFYLSYFNALYKLVPKSSTKMSAITKRKTPGKPVITFAINISFPWNRLSIAGIISVFTSPGVFRKKKKQTGLPVSRHRKRERQPASGLRQRRKLRGCRFRRKWKPGKQPIRGNWNLPVNRN